MEDHNIVKIFNDTKINNDKDILELELRLLVDNEIYWKLYNKLLNDENIIEKTIDCSLNIITRSNNKSFIRKFTYINGQKNKEEYYSKESIIKPIKKSGTIPYSININIEKQININDFITDDNSIARFKIRTSFLHKNSKWRYDLTLVKEDKLSLIKTNLKELVKMFDKNLSIENIENIHKKTKHVYKYEVELEYIGDILISNDLYIINNLFDMIDTQHKNIIEYGEEAYFIAKQLYNENVNISRFKNIKGIKSLANQVIALSKTNYPQIYPPVDYYATDKADGMRAIASLHGKTLTVLTNKLIKFNLVDEYKTTIIDCEAIIENEKLKLYAFDAMVCEDINISNLGFESRIDYIIKAVDIINKITPCFSKTFIKISDDLEKSFKDARDLKNNYKNEGIIITAPGKSYIETLNYKFKDISENTIDFLAVKCPKQLLGTKPYNNIENKYTYILCSGIDDIVCKKLGLKKFIGYDTVVKKVGTTRYYPIQFTPSIDPYAHIYYHNDDTIDNRVVELILKTENNITRWEFVRIREDRDNEINNFGNDYKVAELLYNNYFDPFKFEDLIKPSWYFDYKSDDIYVASNKYKRYVISILLQKYAARSTYLIDLAAGRGADLIRYINIGVKNALFIDIDSAAISELIRRKFDIVSTAKNRKSLITSNVDNNMKIMTLIADLKKLNLLNEINRYSLSNNIDFCVCNFAIHYLCDTKENITHLFNNVSSVLKPNGKFLMTYMDGNLILDLLHDKKINENITFISDNIEKYKITRKFVNTKPSFGQFIEIKLPFSQEDMIEPLVYTDMLVKIAKKFKLSVELNVNFINYIEEFKKSFGDLYKKLSNIDIDYIKLHNVLILTKK